MDINLNKIIQSKVEKVHQSVRSRAVRAANELRNAELEVLRGQRSGRIYRKPYSSRTYRASAPGEAPANRTGQLRLRWKKDTSIESGGKQYTVRPAITSNLDYAPILEKGGKHMAARPYEDLIIQKAKPNIDRIFQEPIL